MLFHITGGAWAGLFGPVSSNRSSHSISAIAMYRTAGFFIRYFLNSVIDIGIDRQSFG